MISPPHTRAEAEKVRYYILGTNSRGQSRYEPAAYSEKTCAFGYYEVQCSRKPKHGPAKLYCKQHAEKVSGE